MTWGMGRTLNLTGGSCDAEIEGNLTKDRSKPPGISWSKSVAAEVLQKIKQLLRSRARADVESWRRR